MKSILQWIRPRERWEFALWTTILLCVAGVFFIRVVIRVADPQGAVDGDWLRYGNEILSSGWGADREPVPDPWGSPWRLGKRETLLRVPPAGGFQRTGYGGRFAYSVGPNGVDERGGGDDRFALVMGPLRSSLLLAGFFAYPRECSAVLAFHFIWVLFWARLKRRKRLWVEGLLAVVLGSFPAVLVGVLVRNLEHIIRRFSDAVPGVLVDLPIAVGGAGALLVFIVALLWRLRRPLADPPEDSDRTDSPD